jgi:hypothetical protein
MQAPASTAMETTEAPKQQYLITRRFNVHISGAIKDWNVHGAKAATWAPVNGKHGEVFGLNDVFESQPDANTTASVLQGAVLHKLTVLEQKNDFPCNIGVTISCIPSEELTNTGQRYAITALPNSHNTTPCVCFSAAESETDGHVWRSRYPNYTAQNLEEHGVLSVAGQPFVFVSQKHPVIDLLRQNADLLSANIDEQPLINGEWYKITRQVMGTCCQTLRNKVLNRVSTRDLNNFEVQLHRVGRSQWLSEAEAHEDHELISAVPHHIVAGGNPVEIQQSIDTILNTPRSFWLRCECMYEINA